MFFKLLIYVYVWQQKLKKHPLVHHHFTNQNLKYVDQEFILKLKQVN